MTNFPKKKFEGVTYDFKHLDPVIHQVTLDAAATATAMLHVTYSIHCFTEEFDSMQHTLHHRYTHAGETRAFDVIRYNCSMGLPAIIANLARAKVYRAMNDNYTYVAHIPVAGQQQPYSLFFTLKAKGTANPSVSMHVQSAYLKPLTVGANATNWRFGSLLGQLTGVFTPNAKKTKPKKKAVVQAKKEPEPPPIELKFAEPKVGRK